MIIADAAMIALVYFLAYLLRFDREIPPEEWINIKKTLPFIIPLKLSVFFMFGLYQGMWRYTSLVDLKKIVAASFVASMTIVTIMLYKYRIGFPRSVYVIDWILTLLFINGFRVAIRLLLANNIFSLFAAKKNIPAGKRLLIIGAGNAGEKFLREINENPSLKYDVVGFLDDEEDKQGKTIHGIQVLGRIDQVKRLRDDFDEILIAIPSAKSDQMRRIVEACEKTAKRFRTMPNIGELIGGKISIRTIREVTIEDILGRDEINLDQEKIKQYLNNKRILITGAGGSIGSELAKQIGHFHPQAIALLDFSEFNLFQVSNEMNRRYGFLQISDFLVDIRDQNTVNRTFNTFKPDVIFHAAAYKHVPMQEFHPWEAVHNNVLGTLHLVDASLKAGVQRFVLVSSDKAVRPSNVMGATKRIAEMLIESKNGGERPQFMAVRFGNVLRSSGSVIPVFQDQIARGGPVTVTHPEVTRYFMSIPEATQLILQAGAMGHGGEIFILHMGKPVRILDMAHDLIRLHGLEPDRDIPIQFIGLRPGEKLYEELITEEEGIVSTSHEKILVLRGKPSDPEALKKKISELLSVTQTYDCSAIKKMLKEIVPDYQLTPPL